MTNTHNIPILNNHDIEAIGKQNNIQITVINQWDYGKYKCHNGCYVFNINDASGETGHWTALYIDNNYACYFDSFGVIPSPQIIRFIKGKKWIYNKNDLQHIVDVSCGFYCIAFLHHMKTHREPLGTRMRSFCYLFKNDTNKNVDILRDYIKKYFV